VSDYYQDIDSRPSQGDIIEIAPHARLSAPLRYVSVASDGSMSVSTTSSSEALSSTREQLALLLTPDCELDKTKTRFWHISPIHPLSAVNGTDQGNIRKNKVFNFLFLPGFKNMPDSFLDLSWITTIDSELVRSKNRLMTLTDLARSALYMQQIRWTSRWTLSDVRCPQCQLQFNPADALPVRAE